MIENILIIDCETTGLDPNNGADLIEICAVIYNLKHKAVLQVYSTLFPCEKNAAEHINQISPEITNLDYSLEFCIDNLLSMSDRCQAIVAHNAQFDRKFIEYNFHELAGRDWVCTQRDFKWPLSLNRLRLKDICEASGIAYREAHRAYADCMLLVQCFNKVEDLVDRFNPPRI